VMSGGLLWEESKMVYFFKEGSSSFGLESYVGKALSEATWYISVKREFRTPSTI
jgi:hypothetical protein